MKYKYLMLLIIAILTHIHCMADSAEEHHIAAQLKTATVYLQGATLTHTAKATLKSGTNEIYIENLSPQIDRNSLKVIASGGVVISASEFSANYIADAVETRDVQRLRDSIEMYKSRQKQLQHNLDINHNMLQLLDSGTMHNMIVKDKNTTTDAITANMNLYKTQATTLYALIDAEQKNKRKVDERIDKLTQQLNQDSHRGRKYSGILKLTLNAALNTTATFSISYFTSQAAWTPSYEINIASIGMPVNLQAKAHVTQTTGLDWDRVMLTLSNAIPSRTNQAPEVKAWLLRYQDPSYNASYRTMAQAKTSVVTNNAMFMLNDVEEVNSTTDVGRLAEVVYVVDGEVHVEIDGLDPSRIATQTVVEGDEAAVYGALKAVIITTKQMNDYVDTDNDITVDYAIALPYSIPGNGKTQNINLKNYNIKGTYYYFAVPRLEQETYLMAILSDWEKYNLISGEATVNYAGTYIGKSYLNTGTTQPQLKLTLTNDPRVTVKREKRRDYSESKVLGNNKVVTYSYQITVKNNKNQAIKFELKEQYPLSTTKAIEVKLLEHTPQATRNDEGKGVLTWDMELKSGESRTFVVTYSVKYLKDRRLDI